MSGSSFNFNWVGVDPDDPVSLVRAALGDTDTSDPLFSDDTIEAVLTLQTSPVLAAASLADMQGAKVSRKTNKKIGKTSINVGDEAKKWFELADRLRQLGPGDIPGGSGAKVGGVLAGGITRAEFANERSQTKYQPYSNEIGMDDNPGGPREVGRKHDTRSGYDDCF